MLDLITAPLEIFHSNEEVGCFSVWIPSSSQPKSVPFISLPGEHTDVQTAPRRLTALYRQQLGGGDVPTGQSGQRAQKLQAQAQLPPVSEWSCTQAVVELLLSERCSV